MKTAIIRNCPRCGTDYPWLRGEVMRCKTCRIPKPAPLEPSLTFREEQLGTRVAKGMLNKEIAHELHLTEGTVKEYLWKIYQKFGFRNRMELALYIISRADRQ